MKKELEETNMTDTEKISLQNASDEKEYDEAGDNKADDDEEYDDAGNDEEYEDDEDYTGEEAEENDSNMKKSGKNRKIRMTRKAAAVLAAVLVLSIGTVSFAGFLKPKQSEMTSTVQTETITKKDLTKSISVTGNISSAASYSVSTDVTDAKVAQVNVKVGDRVKAGDIIALLDTTNVQKSLNLAQQNLAAAQEKNALDLAAAKRNYDAAVSTADVQASRTAEDTKTAQNVYNKSVTDTAASKAENTKLGNNLSSVAKTESDAQKNAKAANDDMSQKAKALSEAQNRVDTLKNSISVSDNNTTVVDQATYDAAVAALSAAQSAYDASKTNSDNKNAALTSAQNALSDVKSKKTESDSTLKSNAAAVDTNKTAAEKAQQAQDDAGRTNSKAVADSKDSITSSKVSATSGIITAQQDVDKYQQQIDSCTIKAPADGIVTTVDVKVGDSYKGGEIAMIQDDGGYKVSATVDQYDISDIAVGLNTTIKTETTGDQDMSGKITFVSPTPKSASTTSTTTTDSTTNASNNNSTGSDYPIEVTIDNPSNRLRIGMTAKLTIVEQEAKGALTVSDSAVQTDEKGNTFVEVQTGNDGSNQASTKKIPVKYGLKTDYYVQITGDGIKEGMQVVIPSQQTGTDTTQTTASGTEALQ